MIKTPVKWGPCELIPVYLYRLWYDWESRSPNLQLCVRFPFSPATVWRTFPIPIVLGTSSTTCCYVIDPPSLSLSLSPATVSWTPSLPPLQLCRNSVPLPTVYWTPSPICKCVVDPHFPVCYCGMDLPTYYYTMDLINPPTCLCMMRYITLV